MINSHPIASSVDSSIMTSSSTSTPHSPTFPRFPQHLRTAPYSEPIQSEASKRRVRFTFGYDDEDSQYSSSSPEQPLPPLPSYTEKEAVAATTTPETRPTRSPSPTFFPSMRIIAPSAYDTLIAYDNDTPSRTYTTESTPVTTSTTTPMNDPIDRPHPALPALSDLVSSIPLRTSSMTSSSCSPTVSPSNSCTNSPRNSSETLPAATSSRCSSMNSMNSTVSATWSLDHRSMHRPPVSSSKRFSSTSKRPSSFASTASYASSSRTIRASSSNNEKALPSLPVPDSSSTQRRPSVAERTAFLASAPIRSTLAKHSKESAYSHYHQQSFARSTPSLPARFKNMSPISSSSTSRATVSSPTLSLTTFSAMHLPSSMSRQIRTSVPLEKRRWSNDSTRGIHGLALLEGAEIEEDSVGSSSYLDDEDDEDVEIGSDYDFKKAHSVHGYNSYTKKKSSSKPKKIKKKCIVLSTFESLLKKQ